MRKLKRIQFRGPDASIFRNYENKVILGHNRLSIIDLDPRSHQPFDYLDLHIVFNGEIYNFQDIKNELIQKGHHFNTTSDTEVLCAAYKEWREKCLEKMNGMFAFVIYDTQNNILFGARDRFGKKPFHYTLKDNNFEFGSQPSQLAIANDLTVNDTAISQFLSWQYVPEPDCIFSEVKKLKAGHYFTYNLDAKAFKEAPYWDLRSDNEGSFEGTYQESKEILRGLLDDAVTKRMISDVPLGVFLSGGIDSSLITAIAQRNSKQPVKSFSIKFNEKGFDESPFAEAVAQHLGTDHTTIPCTYEEGISLIENYHTYFDEPFADASAIPSMLLAKHTRRYVTVALSGDAGDEGFLGYHRYDWILKAEEAYNYPYFLRKFGANIFALSPKQRHQNIAEFLDMPSINDAYKAFMSYFKPKWLITPSVSEAKEYEEWLYTSKKLLERVSDYDIKTYLNSDINTKVDRATMAFSLEARAPLMDYRIIEFSRTLPTAFKYNNGEKKYILKDILYELIPKSIFERPKQGFGMPLDIWFRSTLKPYVLDNLTEKNLKDIPNLNINVVQQYLNEHFLAKANRSTLIWNLLVLVQWLKNEAYNR